MGPYTSRGHGHERPFSVLPQSRLAWSSRMTLILSVAGVGRANARTRQDHGVNSMRSSRPDNQSAAATAAAPRPTKMP